MEGAIAVRPNQPAIRRKSTRSTRNTDGNPQREPQIRRDRPSTRGVGQTGAPRRRTASTRNRLGEGATQPSTRARSSTRKTSTRGNAVPSAEPVSVKRIQIFKRPEFEKPKPKVFAAGASRTKVYGEKREAKRNLAPVQFFLVMFLVVVVSVFAFGLLQENPEMAKPDRPDGAGESVIYEKGTTSTNTGILRGR